MEVLFLQAAARVVAACQPHFWADPEFGPFFDSMLQ